MTGRWQSHSYLSNDESLSYETLYDGRFDDLKPTFIMFIDLDNFHAFNKTHGHAKGDTILKEIWELILRHLEQEAYAMRYGGEEFLALLPADSKEQAIRLATEIQRDIALFYSSTGGKITVSIGLGRYRPTNAELSTEDNFSRIINAAQHEAKITGRNKLIYVSSGLSEKDSYHTIGKEAS